MGKLIKVFAHPSIAARLAAIAVAGVLFILFGVGMIAALYLS